MRLTTYQPVSPFRRVPLGMTERQVSRHCSLHAKGSDTYSCPEQFGIAVPASVFLTSSRPLRGFRCPWHLTVHEWKTPFVNSRDRLLLLQSELNRQHTVYETVALPLSYANPLRRAIPLLQPLLGAKIQHASFFSPCGLLRDHFGRCRGGNPRQYPHECQSL